LITFFFLGLDLGLSLPATAFLHSSRLRLIKAKEKFDAERIIKTFDDSEIQVLNGRFGPYIWNGKKKGN
jgi:topoisomerase IA-like protein